MTEVNGVGLKLAQLEAKRDAAAARGDFVEAGQIQATILSFNPQPKGGTEVEHAGTQPLTAEQQATKKAAQQNANEEIAQMKAATTAKDVYEEAKKEHKMQVLNMLEKSQKLLKE